MDFDGSNKKLEPKRLSIFINSVCQGGVNTYMDSLTLSPFKLNDLKNLNKVALVIQTRSLHNTNYLADEDGCICGHVIQPKSRSQNK
ncbi:hypothetical protein CR513_05466, partial [Mucuna pruriens]